MAYFSNGSEGMVFDDECAECPAQIEGCPVAMAHALHNYDQVGNDLARTILNYMVTQTDGKYMGCQIKKIIDKIKEQK